MTAISTWLVLGAMVVMTTGCGKPKDGVNGKDGAAGSNGHDGSSCSTVAVAASTVAPNGGSMIHCGDGTSSLVLNGTNGINGTNGSDGAAGHDGANGSNGTPGTVIAPIQFCSGGVTHYPSTFPEFGFCINDEIYAVYSANGGFLAKIAPGTWSSNAIGSSCTFSVYDHCQVVQR